MCRNASDASVIIYQAGDVIIS